MTHDEQCIATLRRDVALWRELAKLAVHRLADALRENEALRRRPAAMMEKGEDEA